MEVPPSHEPLHKPPTGISKHSSSTPSPILVGSHQVRDTIYKEWLAEKEEQRQRNAKAVRLQAKKEQAILVEKQLSRKEKSEKCVREWTAKKKSCFLKKQAHMTKMEEEQKIKEEEQKSKKVDNENACKAWLDKKSEALKEITRQRVVAEQREKERKEEEISEKKKTSQKAFEAWASKKVAIITEQKKNEQTKAIQVLNKSISLKEQKQVEASQAFETWKKQKDARIKTVGKMYTYLPNPRQPPKLSKWCPARSVKYDYPCDKHPNSTFKPSIRKGRSSNKFDPHHPNDDTYSLESFDSDNQSPIIIEDSESVSDS